jgi:hypothetical protein
MKMVKFYFSLLVLTGSFGNVQAQTPNNDSLNKSIQQLSKDVQTAQKLKVTGWLQAQYQWTETNGAKTFDGGDFLTNSNNRFMIRRGRVKFTYTQKLTQYVLQLNATERGVNLVDIYGVVKDPWSHQFALTVGVMNRPFGYEIQQSSANRETPERSRFTQVLLPNERDLGAMVTFQPTKGKKMFGLKVDAGFFNGTGIAVPGTTSLNGAGVVDFDKFKDFMAHAVYQRTTKSTKVNYGFGGSYYNGGFILQSNKLYNSLSVNNLGLQTWIAADTSTTTFKGKRAERTYYDVEFQVSFENKLGKTSVRSEYIFGTQTGTINNSKSPSSLPTDVVAYARNFDGFYTYLIQRIGKSKHEVALKYEWYDPNTKLAAKDFAVGTMMKDTELKYTMLGIGYNYYLDENVKFMCYYNFVKNESAMGITGFNKDLKDDVFTIRMQYRF